jgi:hypothetical protein
LIRNYTTYRWASITDVQEKLSILKRQHSPLFTMFCGLNCPPGSGSPLNPNPVRIPIKSGYNPDPPHGPKHIKKNRWLSATPTNKTQPTRRRLQALRIQYNDRNIKVTALQQLSSIWKTNMNNELSYISQITS